jgi:hypothetical protein
MAIGPVQLIVLGFDHPDFRGEIITELERLKATDSVRVIDSLVVYKDADGQLNTAHLSNLTTDEARELGSVVGALIDVDGRINGSPTRPRTDLRHPWQIPAGAEARYRGRRAQERAELPFPRSPLMPATVECSTSPVKPKGVSSPKEPPIPRPHSRFAGSRNRRGGLR